MTGHGYGRRRDRRRNASAHYLTRRQRRAIDQAASLDELTFDHVVDPERLIATYHALRGQGGDAPGPDGLSYRDLGPSEVGECLRALAEFVRRGAYRPSAGRTLTIPKPAGGTRTLTIRNIFDRVVSATVNGALAPAWDRHFLSMSYGFRPGRGTWDLLADLMTDMTTRDRHVLAVDDIRGAFDHVRIADVLDDHRQYIKNTELLVLIERVIRGGGTNAQRTVGLHQGDPLSPTALNARLHHVHDLPLAREGRDPLAYRYVDNIVYLCASVPEGNEAIDRCRSYLAQAGLDLKGRDGPPIDLRDGEEVQLLGFTLRVAGTRPILGLGETAWDELRRSLDDTHRMPDPSEAARRVVNGWIRAYGPALEGDGTAVTARVRRLAAERGHREPGSADLLKQRAVQAHRHWEMRLRTAPGGRGGGATTAT